jgi:hypothetical protein
MGETRGGADRRVQRWEVHGHVPWQHLSIQTVYTRYELEAVEHARLMVMVRGGRFFAEPRHALVAGARSSHAEIQLGTIRVGCPLELHAEGQVVLTSPVRSIEIQS